MVSQKWVVSSLLISGHGDYPQFIVNNSILGLIPMTALYNILRILHLEKKSASSVFLHRALLLVFSKRDVLLDSLYEGTVNISASIRVPRSQVMWKPSEGYEPYTSDIY